MKLLKLPDAPEWLSPVYTGFISPIDGLIIAGAKPGIINMHPDPDGVIRKVPLVFNYRGKLLPSFPLAVVSVISNGYTLHNGSVSIGGKDIRINSNGDVYVNYRGGFRTFEYVSFSDVFSGRVPEGFFTGKIVLFGTSVSGLSDIRPVPFFASLPGVEIHANTISNILRGDFVHVAEPFLNYLVGFILIFLLVLIAYRMPTGGSVALLVFMLAGYLILSFFLFMGKLLMVEVFRPLLGMVFSFLIGLRVRLSTIEFERRKLKETFSRYVPPEIVDKIIKIMGELVGRGMVSISKIQGDTLSMISIFDRGRIIHNGDYRIKGSIWEEIIGYGREIEYYNLLSRYPKERFFSEWQIDYMFSVPVISSKETVTGIISFMDREKLELSQEDIELIKILSRRISFEWEKEREEKWLDYSHKKIWALYKVVSSLNQPLSLEKILQNVTMILVDEEFFKVKREALIFLIDREKGNLNLKYHLGITEEIAQYSQSFKIGECLCGKAAREGRIIYCPDCSMNPAHTRHLPGHGTHADICIPLKSRDRVFGVIHLHRDIGAGFSDEDMDIFEMIGNHVGMAIDNALMFEEIQNYSIELEKRVRERTVELERANRAKSEFLASVSHELRTPLNVIIGFSEVLKEGYFGLLNEKQLEYVEDILDSGRHLLSLINDILLANSVGSAYGNYLSQISFQLFIFAMAILIIRQWVNNYKARLQLESSLRFKNRVLSVIAHDLKNPIASVAQFSDLLVSKPERATSKHVINSLRESSQAAVTLLDNLLYWGRSESARLSINPVAIEMKILVIVGTEHCENQCRRKGKGSLTMQISQG